jgi:hypothetical protein
LPGKLLPHQGARTDERGPGPEAISASPGAWPAAGASDPD